MPTESGKVLVLQVMLGNLYAEVAAMKPIPQRWLAARALELSDGLAQSSEGIDEDEAEQLRDVLNGVFEIAEGDLARLQARREPKA